MKTVLMLFMATCFSFATEGMRLADAIKKVKEHNSEILIAAWDEQIKSVEHQMALGAHYGTLELSQSAIRSNDALSVFGFKLQSREATFADFGFKQFTGANYTTTPEDLNYPKTRNQFQTKLEYTVPLYTGGKLDEYGKITKALEHMSRLDKEALILQKIYELKKSFFAISLLDAYVYHLQTIATNTSKLEAKTAALLEEGYVKKIDLLEVQNKQADVARMLSQAKANRTLLYHFISFLLDEEVVTIEGVYENAEAFLIPQERIINDTLAIKKAEQGVEISKRNIAVHESAFLPQIGAFANYGSSDDTVFNAFAQNDAYTVGVSIKWNLFNGGNDKKGLEKARMESLKATQQWVLVQQQTLLHVKQLQTQIQNHEAEIHSLQKEVELSHLIYENYAERYAQKLLSIHEVLMKHSDELSKVLRLKEVQNARNEKIFELQKLAGKEVE